MILDRPPPEWKRPSIPLAGKVAALERLFGMSLGPSFGRGAKAYMILVDMLQSRGVARWHFDHRPPLSERPFDTEKWDTIPPANDPDHIEVVTPEEHDRRTNGPGGEKRSTSAGSDTHRRAQARRLKKAEAAHQAVMAVKAGVPADMAKLPKVRSRWARGQKIPSRPFHRRKT